MHTPAALGKDYFWSNDCAKLSVSNAYGSDVRNKQWHSSAIGMRTVAINTLVESSFQRWI